MVGEADTAGGGEDLFAVYLENGKLDPSFSGDGRFTVDLGGNDGAWDVRRGGSPSCGSRRRAR